MATLSGPMFEPSDSNYFQAQPCLYCRQPKEGAHYNQFQIRGGVPALRSFFPTGKADEMNFVLFSTSGVHGTYTTIEQIEESLTKYGVNPSFDGDDWPDDYRGNELTVLIVQPRICCLRYGTVDVALEDIPFLKGLRASSAVEMVKIGFPG